MRRLTTVFLAAAFATTAATPALAQNSGYASLGYAFSKVEPKHSNSGARVGAMQFAFGGWLNTQQTFGGEARIALGLGSDKFRLKDNSKAKAEIDRYYGGYFRAQFPNTLPVRPYGLLGFTRAETTEKHPNKNRSRDYNDISLGFGVDVDIDPNIYVYAEYLRLSDRSSRRITNLTLGVGGRF